MLEQLRKKIKDANLAYRIGKPVMSDRQYDILIEELSNISPNDELLTKVGFAIEDETRKVRLPITMASMNKTKSLEEIITWCRLRGISINEEVILLPKFDGLSLCVDEDTQEATTRGDGEFGQRSDDHYKLIKNHNSPNNLFSYTYGEIMMRKSIFLSKYAVDFANPRNLVSGLINSKTITNSLHDCEYIKYGGIPVDEMLTKKEIIDELNKSQDSKVNYEVCKISDLTEEILIDLFHKWSIDYEIDGLIIEVNNLEKQEILGRERSSNNPVWARAFKHPSFEQSAETEIMGLTWNISKQGYLKPTLHVRPVRLNGVTVSNVTGNNARFVKDMGLGIGAKVLIKRSGMVIPIIVDVIETVDFIMPPVENIDWNENGVELVTLTETDDQKLKKLIAFFEILEAKNVSEGVITQLWEAGYKTISDILNLKTSDFEKIARFGKRKATIVFNSIQGSVKDISLSKLQHATGMFTGLGSKKLLLLEHFEEKPTVGQIVNIEGFAETSALSYINNYDNFFKFIKDLPITIKKTEVSEVANDGDLVGSSFVFTGVRSPESEKMIELRGGKIGSGVSKTTTHLIVKSVGSGSSKEKKAMDLGIEILTLSDLTNMLKN